MNMDFFKTMLFSRSLLFCIVCSHPQVPKPWLPESGRVQQKKDGMIRGGWDTLQ
jgi:hypothetical protein